MREKQTMREFFGRIIREKTTEELEHMMVEATKLMSYYRCAILEVETKFRVLNEQFSILHERNPIESIKTRLKSFESIREKLQRNQLPFSLDVIEEKINDIAGVRVICAFLDDIYVLADCIAGQDDITILKVKDYIKNPKENGYRSLHLILEIPIFLSEEKRKMKVEVQLRTIAMESWANLEHRMRYKKNLTQEKLIKTADMLSQCADLSSQLDQKMQAVRDIVEH